MSEYLDNPPVHSKPIDTTWVEGLALDELNMEESGVVRMNEHLDPMLYLEDSSIRFMDTLREKFELFVTQFNHYRGGQSNQGSLIKLFKISNTINDFMLYRNALKLVVARKANDLISIGFLSNTGGLFAARIHQEMNTPNMAHEIKAHVGPFNDISWRFNGETVDINSLSRHYLTEFVKHSAQ